MKRIAILCSGPSLSLFDADAGDKPEAVLAVNRAATLKPADVWVCIDLGSVESGRGVRGLAGKVLGKPRLLTTPTTAAASRYDGDVLKDADFWSLFDRTRIGWTLFSSTTAVAYAAHLGATHIDIYGMDLQGLSDADGAENDSNREFWKNQGEILNILAAHLKRTAGVQVTRHLLPVPEPVNEPAVESDTNSDPAPEKPAKKSKKSKKAAAADAGSSDVIV